MIPVNIAAMDFSSAPKLLASALATRIKSGEFKVATTLAELQEIALESGFVDLTYAVTAGLIGAEVALNVGSRVYVHEFSYFRDYEEEKEVVRVGVGIRFVFIVEVFNFELDIRCLPALAAAAQLNLAKVSTQYRVIGIHGKAIIEALPRTVDTLSAEGLARILETIDKVREGMNATNGAVVISPAILGVNGPKALNQPITREVVTRVAALQCIVNGLTRSKAIAELVGNRHLSSELSPTIESTYAEIVGSEKGDIRPPQPAIEKAKNFLFGVLH